MRDESESADRELKGALVGGDLRGIGKAVRRGRERRAKKGKWWEGLFREVPGRGVAGKVRFC